MGGANSMRLVATIYVYMLNTLAASQYRLELEDGYWRVL